MALGEVSPCLFLQLAVVHSQIPWAKGKYGARKGPFDVVLLLYSKHPVMKLFLTGIWGTIKTIKVGVYFFFSVAKVLPLQLFSF